MRYRNFGAVYASLFTLVFGAACADTTMPERDTDVAPAVLLRDAGPSSSYTLPPMIVVGHPRTPECDPSMDLNFCQGEPGPGRGQCISGTGFSEMTISSCPIGGTGGTGGGSSPGQPTVGEGPGAFAACVGGLLFLMGSTAMLEPLAHNLYEAREDYASAKRMYDAVMANNPAVEMEMIWAHKVEAARSSYRDAVRDYALAAGASVLAVGSAVVLCSPGLILPTP